MTTEEIDRLAARLHEKWMEHKTNQGLHPVPLCSSFEQGGCPWCHGDMRHYSRLDERSKQTYRAQVQAILSEGVTSERN